MRKYRNEILVAIYMILFNIVISIWSNMEENVSYYDNILRQFHYQVIFSALLFFHLYDEHDPTLLYVRYVNYERYIKQNIIEAMKRYGVLFLLITIGQCILFQRYDPLFQGGTVLYINSVFYVLILFVKYLILTMNHRKQKIWIASLYVIWFLLFRAAFDFQDHPLQIWNPFHLISQCDGKEIIRNLMVLIVCICINQLRMIDHERFMKKWLESEN